MKNTSATYLTDAEKALAYACPTGFQAVMLRGRAARPPHIALLERYLLSIASGQCKRLIVALPPRHGKAVHIVSHVATPSGWTTAGELKVGDQVFGRDGKPCNVVAVQRWEDRPLYDVRTDDRETIVADEEHEWEVRLDRKRPRFKTYTTGRLAARTSPRNPLVRQTKPLDLPDAILPHDPWNFGYWIGNGFSTGQTIQAGGPIGDGAQDQEWVRAKLEAGGWRTSDRLARGQIGLLGVAKDLERIGKAIPMAYMRASVRQRLALLQGLVDSDGHVHPDGQVEFTTVRRELALQVQELVWTFGVKCFLAEERATLNGQDMGPKFRLTFYMKDAASLPRKAAKCRDSARTPDRFIKVTNRHERGPTVCIEVDSPDHMFLVGRSLLPTHNSELTSRAFPAWFLGRFPTKRVVLAAYANELATDHGRRVRESIAEFGNPIFGIGLKKDSNAADAFEIQSKAGIGSLRCVGRGTGLTGFGADLIVVDDPIKDAAEAASPTVRNNLWDWWQTTLYTRLEPGASVIVIATRWSEDDLTGRLMRLEREGGKPWTKLILPALAEENDPLGRKPGEALWPERFSREDLETRKAETDPYFFAAMYQQQPSPRSGSIFRRELFRYCQEQPDGTVIYGGNAAPVTSIRRFSTVDLAVTTKTTSDWTVVANWGLDRQGHLFLLHLERAKLEFPDLIPFIRRVAVLQGKSSTIWVEAVAFQVALVQEAKRQGLPVREHRPNKDKVARATFATDLIASGKMWFLLNAPWLPDFESELLVFDRGAHDDQVDVVSMAASVWSSMTAGAMFDLGSLPSLHDPLEREFDRYTLRPPS